MKKRVTLIIFCLMSTALLMAQAWNLDSCVAYAQKQNYDIFYEKEIYLREQLNYPPFCDIIVFGISSSNKEEVEIAAKKLFNILQKNNI